MVPAWQHRRLAFSHDWLKNTYLPGLESWLNLLDGKIEDPHLERTFIEESFVEWEAHRDEAATLIRDFQDQMSPLLVLVQPSPLVARQTAGWLGHLLHALWMARFDVTDRVAHAQVCFEMADATYHEIQAGMAFGPNVCTTAAAFPFKPLFETFTQGCRNLGGAIAAFPSKIHVV